MTPRFIPCDRPESITIKIDPDRQLQLGTFEHAVDLIVDRHIDLTVFYHHYHNALRGRPAYNPKTLLKIILVAYSRGIITSRKIEAACRENTAFMVLAAQTTPNFTTLANLKTATEKPGARNG